MALGEDHDARWRGGCAASPPRRRRARSAGRGSTSPRAPASSPRRRRGRATGSRPGPPRARRSRATRSRTPPRREPGSAAWSGSPKGPALANARPNFMASPSGEAGRIPCLPPMRGNVLFVTADQWRGECLGALGHPVVRTPVPRRAGRPGRLLPPPLRPGGALRAEPRVAPHRPLPAQPPLGDERHAPRRPPHQLGPRGAQARLRPGAVRLHRHQPGSAQPRSGAPPAAHLRGAAARGSAPACMLGENPIAWARWLEKKGYAVPDPPWKLYRWKKEQLEWEDGGPSPRPSRSPPSTTTPHFMVEQADRAPGGAGRPALVRAPLAAAPPSALGGARALQLALRPGVAAGLRARGERGARGRAAPVAALPPEPQALPRARRTSAGCGG